MNAENEDQRAEAMGKVDDYLDKITSLPKTVSKSVNRTVINKYKEEEEEVKKMITFINTHSSDELMTRMILLISSNNLKKFFPDRYILMTCSKSNMGLLSFFIWFLNFVDICMIYLDFLFLLFSESTTNK